MTTKNLAIVYYSGSGHTHLLAEAVARGAKAVSGVNVELLRITGGQIKEGRWQDEEMLKKLNAADAIVFGTATYMGGASAQFKAFADATGMIWYQRGWVGKLAGGFTHSGTASGDKLSTLQYLVTLAAQHGMLWVTQHEIPSTYFGKTDGLNRFGFYIGAAGQTPFIPGTPATLDAGDALTGETYGRHVAETALRVNR